MNLTIKFTQHILHVSIPDINVKGGQDEMRPLHMACRYNSGSVTQYLLVQGALVNVKDIKGKTPLHYATRRGHDVVTKVTITTQFKYGETCI